MLQFSVLVCELVLGNLEITSTRVTWLRRVMMESIFVAFQQHFSDSPVRGRG